MRTSGGCDILKPVFLFAALCGMLHQDIFADKSEATNQSLEKPSSKKMGGKSKIHLDTVLVDTLFGGKIFFRIGRKNIVDDFTDTTDVSLEGISEEDSTIFRYSGPAYIQSFKFHRITGNPVKAYLLHSQAIPSAPPTGNRFLIIAPVHGKLKVLDPGRLRFSGDIKKSSREESSDSEGVVAIEVWNGNFGIQFPLSIQTIGDSAYWDLGFLKPDTVSNALVYDFTVSKSPGKAYRKNERITLYSDISRKKKKELNLSPSDEIEIQSVKVRMKSKKKRHSIQDIINACEDGENALLQLKINGKEGFISREDFQNIGYQDAG